MTQDEIKQACAAFAAYLIDHHERETIEDIDFEAAIDEHAKIVVSDRPHCPPLYTLEGASLSDHPNPDDARIIYRGRWRMGMIVRDADSSLSFGAIERAINTVA